MNGKENVFMADDGVSTIPTVGAVDVGATAAGETRTARDRGGYGGRTVEVSAAPPLAAVTVRGPGISVFDPVPGSPGLSETSDGRSDTRCAIRTRENSRKIIIINTQFLG